MSEKRFKLDLNRFSFCLYLAKSGGMWYNDVNLRREVLI